MGLAKKSQAVGNNVLAAAGAFKGITDKDIPGQIQKNYEHAIAERKRKIQVAQELKAIIQNYASLFSKEVKFNGGKVVKDKDGKDVKVQTGVAEIDNLLETDGKTDVTQQLLDVETKIKKRQEDAQGCWYFFKRKKDGAVDSFYKVLDRVNLSTCTAKDLRKIVDVALSALPAAIESPANTRKVK